MHFPNLSYCMTDNLIIYLDSENMKTDFHITYSPTHYKARTGLSSGHGNLIMNGSHSLGIQKLDLGETSSTIKS